MVVCHSTFCPNPQTHPNPQTTPYDSDIERRAILAMGKVQHAKKAAAAAAPGNNRGQLLAEIERATKRLKGIEREQARLTDALKQIAMVVAANAMAHEQRRAERRAGRAPERRERAQRRYSARASRLLAEAARLFAGAAGEKKARLQQLQQQQGGGSASTSALSSPTRSGLHPASQPQHCFRAGGPNGYSYAPDAWRFDPFLCPLPVAVPLPAAVLENVHLHGGGGLDPLLAVDGPGGANAAAAQGSLPLPEEYLAGPPPPPAMLPQRGDAIRGVALDVPNPFDAASRAVAAMGDEGMGQWLPRQESQMRDAVLPAGLLAEAGAGGGNGSGGGMVGGGGEEGAVLERLEGLLGMGAQLLVGDPALLAEARVGGCVDD